jgi:hypothetical protein
MKEIKPERTEKMGLNLNINKLVIQRRLINSSQNDAIENLGKDNSFSPSSSNSSDALEDDENATSIQKAKRLRKRDT